MWFQNQSLRNIVISHVPNSSEFLPLGNSLCCGRHVSHNALVSSRSIGNKKRSVTSFSQRLLVKLHGYRATIRGSNLSLVQVYFGIPLLPFGTILGPKYERFFFWCELFSKLRNDRLFVITHERFHFVPRFYWNRFHEIEGLLSSYFTWSKCHMITKLWFFRAIFSCFAR